MVVLVAVAVALAVELVSVEAKVIALCSFLLAPMQIMMIDANYRRAAFWVSQIVQPSGAVELGEDLTNVATPVGVEGINALHLVCAIAGAADYDPSPRNFPTAVEDVVSLESKW